MAQGDAKSAARSLGLWTPKWSQLILATAGGVAWLIAVTLALLSKGEAVAAAFVAVGAPLIGAAAFYSRVRRVTKDGFEVDPLEQVRELDQRLAPPADGVSALEERRSLIDAIEATVATPSPTPGPDDSLEYLLDPVDRGVQSYERALRLERAAQNWLTQEGYALELSTADRGTDFIARRDGEVYAVEVKSSRLRTGGPTPQALRAYYLQARVWVDANLGQDKPFYRVLITDVVPPPNLLDRYRKEGIGLVRIDPDHDEAGWVLQPRDVR